MLEEIRELKEIILASNFLSTEKRAELGDANAQFEMYLKNINEVKWLKLSAENGCIDAYNSLGVYYHNKRLTNKAMLYYKKSIKSKGLNYHYAYTNLANIYENKKNYLKAKKIYKKAFKLNFEDSKWNYARCLLKEKKFKQAYEIFSVLKNKETYFYLSIMYANGFYVKKNITRSLYYLNKVKDLDWAKEYYKEIEKILKYDKFF